MGLLGWLKFGVEMARNARAASRREEELRVLSWPDFLTAVAAALAVELPRQACTDGDIERWRHAHQVLLPPELRAFYGVADGLPEAHGGWLAVAPLAALQLAGAREPAFSSELAADWQSWGREQQEPFGLKVMSPSLVDLAADDYERVLPFTDTDDMLLLHLVEPGRATLMVASPHPYLPVGTVLDVENLLATRHDGLRAWLASVAAAARPGGMQAPTLARDSA